MNKAIESLFYIWRAPPAPGQANLLCPAASGRAHNGQHQGPAGLLHNNAPVGRTMAANIMRNACNLHAARAKWRDKLTSTGAAPLDQGPTSTS